MPYPLVAGIDFAEGPAFDSKGNLYFVNYVRNGTIGRKTVEGRVEIWVDLGGGQANGIKVDAKDNIIAADYKGKRLLRISPAGKIETLAGNFEGQPFHGLNDVCLDRAGNIYFTDPTDSGKEKPIGAFYRYSTSGKVSRLDSGLAFPNGIAVSPGQKKLYVSDSGYNRILAYDLAPDGTGSGRRTLYQFPDDTVDGIDFDVNAGQDKINKLQDIAGGVRQANKFYNGPFAFFQTYLAIITKVEASGQDERNIPNRGVRSHTTPQRGDTRTTTFRQIVEFPGRAELHDDIGIVFIEIVQPSRLSIDKQATVRVCIYRRAERRDQRDAVTKRIMEIMQ